MLSVVLNSIKRRVNIRSMGSLNLDLEVNRIVWIDMEMTGLDVIKDKIMEIACLITDSDLNIIAEAPRVVIQQRSDILDNMNIWCKKQHGQSGLTEECKQSDVTQEHAEELILNFLKKHVTEKTSPLAGSSVYTDRMFLMMHMSKINEYLHYRIIDVSSIKELCRRWNSDVYKQAPKKEFNHRAIDDIRESVRELKYYKQHFFKIKIF